MKYLSAAAAGMFAAAIVGSSAAAQDGFYYGLTLGYADYESESLGIAGTEGNDVTFGGVLGYSWPAGANNSIGVEATLDLTTKNLMEGSTYPGDACTNNSPDWCEVHSIARLRGVYTVALPSGLELLGTAGVARASGVAEDGPGNYPDTSATGFTLGFGGQRDMGTGSMRVELTYDKLDNADPEAFDKSLRIISLRATYLF